MTGIGSNGLGSLADELAEAWDEEGEDGEDAEEPGMGLQVDGSDLSAQRSPLPGHSRDSGINMPSSPIRPTEDIPLDALLQRTKHRRKPSQRRMSDFSEEDLTANVNELSLALDARLAEVETLAERGVEPMDGQDGDVVDRILDRLKDLGGQATLEAGATRSISLNIPLIGNQADAFIRLITAHMALSTHLTQQTRTLLSLTHPLLTPLSLLPLDHSSSMIDDLLALLSTTTLLIPRPTLTALPSITHLSSLTTDLISTLDHLSDTLHMSRQTTTLATRKLKSSRALVAEMLRERELFNEGVRWIEKGDWQGRLSRRECGGVCREVVRECEDVCRGYRERLAAAEVGAA